MFIIGAFIPFAIVFLIIVFIFLVIMMSRSDSWNFSKFYFTAVSIASVLGMVIAFGIAIYNIVMGMIITDDEYIDGRAYRYVEQCSDPYYMPKSRAIAPPVVLEDGTIQEAATQEPITKTPEEIAECQKAARDRALNQRNLMKKETVAGWLIRGILFAILFFTHYPRMHAVEQVPVAPTKTKKRTAAKRKTTKK